MCHVLHEPRVSCLQHTGKCHQGPDPGLSLVNLQFSGCSLMAGEGKDFGLWLVWKPSSAISSLTFDEVAIVFAILHFVCRFP